MPTDAWFKANPKVSGYVPQSIYDHLIQFKDERGISISQAVTIVLAEYFGVDRRVDQPSSIGVTLAQVQELEKGLIDLAKSVKQRFQELEDKVESIKAFSSSPLNQSKPHTQLGSISTSKLDDESSAAIPEIIQALKRDEEGELTSSESELISKLLDEGVECNTQAEWQNINDVLPSGLQGELPKEEFEQKTALSSETTNEIREVLSIQPLSGGELSERLGANQSVISRYKKGERRQSLAEWSRSVDPEGIAWAFSKELGKYVPTQNISDGSTSSLKSELLIENQDSITKPQVEQENFNRMPLTGEQLAARFGMNSKRSLDNHRTGKQAANFPEWTQSKDPDGIAWHYVRKSKMYYPIKLPSKLLSEPKDNLLNFEASADSPDLDN